MKAYFTGGELSGMTLDVVDPSPQLASLVSKGDELRDACTKTYFGHVCVAFTTRNSLKHYNPFPWNFAIRDGDGWHHYYGIPNKVETRAMALRRAWHRAKWMHDGTYGDHYKANAIAQGREPHRGEASPGATGSTTPGNHGEKA